MPGPDLSLCVLAYMGLGSGLEFLPYFVALLGLVGAALLAVVQQPVLIVLRWLKGGRQQTKEEAAVDATQPHPDEGDDTRVS
ncbi:MAG TPA: hypothetical protein VG125_09930 [Pirellulales bacterium]|nr:hypothetical protein [Pirellulales bacterium]